MSHWSLERLNSMVNRVHQVTLHEFPSDKFKRVASVSIWERTTGGLLASFFHKKIGCFQHGSFNNGIKGIKHTMLPCIDLKKSCYLEQMWLFQYIQDAFHNSVRSWSTSSLWSLGVYHRLYPHDVTVTWPCRRIGIYIYISNIFHKE